MAWVANEVVPCGAKKESSTNSSMIPILQLPMTSTERFEVKVANREALVTEGSCSTIPTYI